jgi:hypothetical protein
MTRARIDEIGRRQGMGEKTCGARLEPISLVEPRLERDGSLADALRARRTPREFSDRPLCRRR